jgi:TonB family protein
VAACFGAVTLLAACGGEDTFQQPIPLYGEIPIDYPMELWDEDVEGTTLLRVLVNELGGVDSAEVVETSGYPAFDSAAVRGAMELRYSPARRGEERVEVWATVPVTFSKRPRS